MFKAKKDNGHYISRQEEREIAKYNRKIMRELEEKKHRKNVSEDTYLTTMKNPNNIVEFDDLHTYFFTDAGTVKSVDGVTFDVPANSTVGVVGESGCGKSVTSLSLMQLVQAPQGQIVSGSIRYNAGDKCYDISKMPSEAMRKIRGKDIAMIFQEPMTSLNPVFTVGYQLDEVSLLHNPGISKEDAKKKSIEMLNQVGIARPEGVYESYPHELSGGMRQRVMIAMALACNPKLLIADEPTTALDVTIQAQIVELLKELKSKINMAIIFITHDLGVIADICDKVAVMYAGNIIETGSIDEIFYEPKHPYTWGLLKSMPKLNAKEHERLVPIEGNPVDLINPPKGCAFAPRCKNCMKICLEKKPPAYNISEGHDTLCWLPVKEEYEKEVKNNGKSEQ